MKYRKFPLVYALGLFGLAGAAFSQTQISGIPNFHKVNAQVYRGGQPTRDGFKALSTLGVKTVIDLRETGEHSQRSEAGWVEADGMRYVSVPLSGLAAPPDEKVAKVLAILNDTSAGPVFVHCRRGADRTGTIMACYRISHDHWGNRRALEEARQLGMRFFERAMQNYVNHYTPALAPAVESGAAAAVLPR